MTATSPYEQQVAEILQESSTNHGIGRFRMQRTNNFALFLALRGMVEWC